MASRFLSGSTTTVVHSKREQINEGTPGPSSYLIYSSQAQEGPLISEKKSIPRMRSKSWGSYRDTSLRLGEPDAERSNTVVWNSWALNPQGTSKLCRFCKAVRPSGPAKCSHFWLESPIHDWTTSSTIRSSSIWQLLFLAIACISNSGVLGMTGERGGVNVQGMESGGSFVSRTEERNDRGMKTKSGPFNQTPSCPLLLPVPHQFPLAITPWVMDFFFVLINSLFLGILWLSSG